MRRTMVAAAIAVVAAFGGAALADDVAFLEQAKKEQGAVTLASGVVVIELKTGVGPRPSASGRVKVHYRGTLTDGTEFDSSYERGKPAEFSLNQVIRCWNETVQRMKPGGKVKAVCPSKTAYGSAGSPPRIPPDATLVFEIELLEVRR